MSCKKVFDPIHDKKHLFHLSYSLILLGVSIFIYFSDSFNAVNNSAFRLLNNTIKNDNIWSRIVGIITYRKEAVLNTYVMVFLYFIAFPFQQLKQHYIGIFRVIFGTFILCILLVEILHRIEDILLVASPALVFDEFYDITKVTGILNIKRANPYSFPSGHTFVTTSWIILIIRLTPASRLFKVLCTFIGFFTLLGRCIVGSHWISDIIITSSMGMAFMNLAIPMLANYLFFKSD